MERRFIVFMVFAVLLLTANSFIARWLSPPQEQEVAADSKEKPVPGKPDAKTTPDQKPDAKPSEVAPAEKPAEAAAAEKEKPAAGTAAAGTAAAEKKPAVEKEKPLPEQWVALGSADPKDPYRMLATLSNRGASVVRVELSNAKYRDLEDRGGYLGHITIESSKAKDGCPVDCVGAGTPAAAAKLKPGDVIRKIDNAAINSPWALREYLHAQKPGRDVTLTVLRDGKEQTLGPVALGRRPLEVLKPENGDPNSFLLTLALLDEEKLPLREKGGSIAAELNGVALRAATWQLVESDQNHAVFRRKLEPSGIEITKTFRMTKVPEADQADDTARAYHLTLEVSVKNAGGQARKVAYQLDGPTGLPTEGYWYAYKSWSSWGGVGLRDVVVLYERDPTLVACPTIAADDMPKPWDQPEPLTFIGVDAQYFSSMLIPQPKTAKEIWFAKTEAIRVGEVDPNWKNKTNTSCRLTSTELTLKPNESISHEYAVFVGPKKVDLLTQYKLNDLVYYGWFWWAAKPMVRILHFFHAIVQNWGLAIIMLTVLVRLCMFPLSRKQAMSMAKMQQIQPELKKLQEKHKSNKEAFVRAQRELFLKHNYNPFGGCLVVFIQLPIFVALYRSLGVDVELRQAPLISESIRWCSNLASPDMLFNWCGFMPEFITSRPGILGLGPYFNLLPIFTIILFIWQQKKTMPPPADEQAAMQQKMMQYMMIFMGIMFFKVASGLCIYFIASSLWGMAERRFLPKLSHATAGAPAAPPPPARPAPQPQAKKKRKR